MADSPTDVQEASQKLGFVYQLEGRLDDLDVFELIPTLQAMGEAIQEASRIVFPDSPPIRVGVKPIRRGSYEIHYALSYLVPALMALMTPDALHKLTQVLNDLGIIKKTGVGALGVIAKLRGRVKKVEQVSPDQYRYQSDNEETVVNGNVHNLLQNPTIINNLNIIVSKVLEKEGVTNIKSYLEGEPEETEINITKDDAPAFKDFVEGALQEPAEQVVENVIPKVYLHPKRGPFGPESGQWSFIRGDIAITATVRDKQFLERYGSGNPRLNAGDVLAVELKEKQKIRGSEITTSYEVTKVLEYIPSYKPVSLPMMDPPGSRAGTLEDTEEEPTAAAGPDKWGFRSIRSVGEQPATLDARKAARSQEEPIGAEQTTKNVRRKEGGSKQKAKMTKKAKR